jgi:ankyrin repeat protein
MERQVGGCILVVSIGIPTAEPSVLAMPSDINAGSSGYTPLHYAARAGHLEAVKLLISSGMQSCSMAVAKPAMMNLLLYVMLKGLS